MTLRKYFIVVFLLVGLPYAAGCGKKGPPRLPVQDSIPAVTNLKADYTDDDKVKLTWSVPNLQKSHYVKGFRVYRSKKTALMTECKKCPVLFDNIADVPISSDAEMTYFENLETGHRYLFKVNAYTEAGSGHDSNVVEFVY